MVQFYIFIFRISGIDTQLKEGGAITHTACEPGYTHKFSLRLKNLVFLSVPKQLEELSPNIVHVDSLIHMYKSSLFL
jgi:hypothetical protein